VRRLELGRIRICKRCGRAAAELRDEAGASIVVRLDPVRARELSQPSQEVRSLTDLVLAALAAVGAAASEVVLDVADDRLRALLSLVRGGEPDVVGCTAEEGVALAVRGGLRLYATEEAFAHAAAGAAERQGGGSDTVH
jgi:hypothetical protein